MSLTPFHTFAHTDYAYAANCRTGVLVPQKVYLARATYSPLPHVRFSCSGVPGVRLEDAESSVIRNLDNRTFVPMLNPVGNRITLRISWPGYEEWQFTSVTIKHHTAQGNGYTMEELAGTVAAHMRKFYQETRDISGSAPGWETHSVPFHALYLLELRHVGQSSWQPVLMYNASG